jgi:hypothetical protein
MADKKNREEVLKDLKDFFVKLGLKHLDSVEKVSAVVESFSLAEIQHMFVVEGIELDEISAHTLGNYVKKATISMAGHAAISAVTHDKDKSTSEKAGKVVGRRAKGIGKATDALTRGHTGKKHGLGFLAKEAHTPDQLKAAVKKHGTAELKHSAKRDKADRLADHHDQKRDYRERNFWDKTAAKHDHKANRHGQAYVAAKKLLKKAGIKEERIEELSAKVLGNYIEKVKKTNPKSVKVRNKRKDGLIKATNKIVAKEEKLEELSKKLLGRYAEKSNKSYQRAADSTPQDAKTMKKRQSGGWLSNQKAKKSGAVKVHAKEDIQEVANLRSPTTKNVKQAKNLKSKKTTNTDAAFKDVNPNKNVGESHIVELSVKTLKSYKRKALNSHKKQVSNQVDGIISGDEGKVKEAKRLAQKRKAGVQRAAGQIYSQTKKAALGEDWGKIAKAVKLILTPEMNAEFKKTKK